MRTVTHEFKVVVSRDTNAKGEWTEVIEINGRQYKVSKVQGNPTRNPYNKRWGHEWWAVIRDYPQNNIVIKVRIDRGAGMPKIVRLTGINY
jgi:hypothetical protein